MHKKTANLNAYITYLTTLQHQGNKDNKLTVYNTCDKCNVLHDLKDS